MANKNQQSAYPSNVRQKWYFLVEKAGKTVDEVCNLYFISRKTYYKWKAVDHGDRTHMPKKEHPDIKLKGEVKVFVVKEKLRLNYGPRKMKLLLKRRFDLTVSTTAIYNLYVAKGLIRRPQKKLPWYQPIKAPVIPDRPGAVVQMDAKYVWQDNQRKYQRTFIDIFTGRQFAVVVSSMTAEDTINAF